MRVSHQAFLDQFPFHPERDFLGKGSMASTYRSYHKVRKRPVAIKIFEYSRPNQEFDLLKEIEQAINLEHDNLIRYFEIFEVDYETHLKQAAIIEYADGGDMRQLLELRPKLEEVEIWIEDVLEGLEYLEKYQIVHRDLKLENILFVTDTKKKRMVAKIADFGLATSFHTPLMKGIRASQISGTPAYLAPELINSKYAIRRDGATRIENNTDFWALGIIIFSIFNRQLPFGTTSENRFLYQIKQDIQDTEILEDHYLKIPQPLRELCQACLTKHAAERPRSVAELKRILKPSQKASRIVIKRKDEPVKNPNITIRPRNKP